MIALLCPSKGRPDKLKCMWESVQATTSTRVKLYLAVSQEDYAQYQQFQGPRAQITIMPELMPTVQKWNYLADIAMQESTNNIFFLAGDDMIFDTPGWDNAIAEHYHSLENKIYVYHLQDSRSKEGTPHPIVTRDYIKALGYMIPPIFVHWEIDVWTVAIAKANNCFTHFKDFKLIHDKDNDKGKPDQTHLGIRSYGWRERDAYVNEKMQHVLQEEIRKLSRIKNK